MITKHRKLINKLVTHDYQASSTYEQACYKYNQARALVTKLVLLINKLRKD